MGTIGHLKSHAVRTLRVSFTPWARDRLVTRPLTQYIQQAGNNKKVSAADFGLQVREIGIDAKLLAARTIRSALAKNKKIQPEKREALEAIAKEFRWVGRVAALLKVSLVYLICRSVAVGLFPAPPAVTRPPSLEFKFDPPPLDLTVQKEDFILYPGEGWNSLLRDKCASFFTAPNRLDEGQLSSCLKKAPDASLSLNSFYKYLRSLQAATTEINFEDEKDTAEIEAALRLAPPVPIKTVSTGGKEPSVPFGNSQRAAVDFSGNYRRAYSNLDLPTPPFLTLFDYFLVLDNADLRVSLPADLSPVLLRTVMTVPFGRKTALYVPFLGISNAISVSPASKLINAYALYKAFEGDLDSAAELLFRYHGHELAKDQIRVLLALKLVAQITSMKQEDPWQDMAACAWSNCTHESSFRTAFSGTEYGISLFGRTWDLPWVLASAVHTPKEQQGFGPYQVTFGLVKEAGADRDVREHFRGYLPDEVFNDDKGAMRALFDRPTYSYALVIDHILSQLEKTTFANPIVRLAPIYPPHIRNRVVARQMALMESAALLATQPERAPLTNNLAHMPSPVLGLWSLAGELLSIDSPFPSLTRRSITSTTENGQRYLTYVITDSSQSY